MPRTLRSKIKHDTVQISSPRKKLQLNTDNKENFLDMGHHKTEESSKNSKKASTLKNLKEENPPAPRTSKRRNALREAVKNIETSKEGLTSKCTPMKSKIFSAETKKVTKPVGKKADKTNLTQKKLNFPSITLPENKESHSVSYQDELLEAAKEDDTYELKNPVLQSFMINSPPYNQKFSEVDMLTSATPPDSYWKELAQQREIALERTLKENESLRDQLEVLQVENVMLKNVVQQAKELACIVKEIVE